MKLALTAIAHPEVTISIMNAISTVGALILKALRIEKNKEPEPLESDAITPYPGKVEPKI